MTQCTREYEFNEEENGLFLRLSKELFRCGISLLTAGVILIFYIVFSFFDPKPLLAISDNRHLLLSFVDYGLWVFISFLVIYVSTTVIRLSIPIKMIATTSGLDISHLMDFMEKLAGISKISFVSLMIICVFLIASFVMLILVF
ncbi:MAG: hypothetical protein NT010_06445 [Proteobacteria bacterium]|nr:hypothetical protein [Pseudomonadota bacterium]